MDPIRFTGDLCITDVYYNGYWQQRGIASTVKRCSAESFCIYPGRKLARVAYDLCLSTLGLILLE